jgi:hypothetical protein
MNSWTATTTTGAAPEQVLDVLTDPSAIHSWSPVPFELEELDGRRLVAGSRARVAGSLGGVRVGFDVHVRTAEDGLLELSAEGPIGMDVAYRLQERDGGSAVEASVSLHKAGGITGRIIAKATGALLSAGALEKAAQRIARAAEASAPAALCG